MTNEIPMLHCNIGLCYNCFVTGAITAKSLSEAETPLTRLQFKRTPSAIMH